MLKKIFVVITMFTMLITVSACNTTSQNSKHETNVEKKEETKKVNTSRKDDKAMIVYFSWSGNTEEVAKEIQKQTNADIFKIIPKTLYTNDYDELLKVAQNEQKNNERPEIANKIENLSDYEIIYLGFPNWYYDMPMIMYSFLEEYDLSGKVIVPFVTSGGSGFSDAIATIKSMEPNAEVLEGLHVGEAKAKNASEEINEWLKKLEFIG